MLIVFLVLLLACLIYYVNPAYATPYVDRFSRKGLMKLRNHADYSLKNYYLKIELFNLMKWKTHVAISRAICRELNLPKAWEKYLCQGSVEPDRYPDKFGSGRSYTRHVPHHRPPFSVIMKYIWSARLAYLRGDFREALKNLGRALHYVQDRCVAKGVLGLSHEKGEEDLALLEVEMKAIRKGIDSAKCSPHYVKSVIKSIKPGRNAEEILFNACMYSASIAGAVLGDKKPPRELIKEYETAKKKYFRVTILLMIRIWGASLIASIVIQDFNMLFGGLFMVFLVRKFDFKYRRLREEVKWFGIGSSTI